MDKDFDHARTDQCSNRGQLLSIGLGKDRRDANVAPVLATLDIRSG